MEAQTDTSQGNILVVEPDDDALKGALEAILRQVPSVSVVGVRSLEEYDSAIEKNDFDIVVLDYGVGGRRGIELIHELKLRDYDPTVIVVSRSPEPHLVSQAYDAGCHRYLIKEGLWIDELGPAVRHLLRIRRLEVENRSLIARLLEANVMLEEKNRRLDEFSATVAHDIRGPLGGICMKLDYILDQYRDTLDPKVTRLLERGLQSGSRLTDIVQAMYDFAKLGAKAAKLEMISIEEVIRHSVADLNVDEAIDVEIGIGPNLPTVWGNADLLRRAFMNLIGNSIKYGDKRPVLINIGLRNVVDKTMAKYGEFYIQDNGPGIPSADLKRVFNFFSRGTAVNTNIDGLGIGLSVVQRITELHFGEVTVESVVGQGSTFVLSLPIEPIYLDPRKKGE